MCCRYHDVCECSIHPSLASASHTLCLQHINTKVFTFKRDFLEMLAANLILTAKGASILASINH